MKLFERNQTPGPSTSSTTVGSTTVRTGSVTAGSVTAGSGTVDGPLDKLGDRLLGDRHFKAEIIMASMYILRCSNGAYYTGSTVDLDRRLQEHSEGLGSNYTRKYLPVELVYREDFDSVAEAFAREKQVQSWSRAKKEALIRGDYESLPTLGRKKSAVPELVEGPAEGCGGSQ